jgi:aspartyl-tRNA(Asn)/glutamyl-tRNA(Gln) amidotransferase subunit C
LGDATARGSVPAREGDAEVPITRKDVLHVATLSRLRLEEAEIERLITDLGKILGYVELLAELDTANVPPTSHVAVASAPLREDRAAARVDREEVLAEAPRRAGDGFAVPGFVDEG